MRYIFAILFCISFFPVEIHSMEYAYRFWNYVSYVSKLILYSTSGPCYIAHLPPEIQTEIAAYLTFRDKEDDPEFIERTESNKQGDLYSPIKYAGWRISILDAIEKQYKDRCLLFNNQKNITTKIMLQCDSRELSHNALFSCSTDLKKVVYSPALFSYKVFDIQMQKRLGLEKTLHHWCILAIAVDSFSSLVAYVNSNNHLIISDYNVDKEISNITLSFKTIKSVAFNKQGTKVIVRDKVGNYEIIPIVDEAAHQAKRKKELEYYLRQRGVCDSLENSK